jgi:2,4-dienoyl-CoA reductase (NADPH2)
VVIIGGGAIGCETALFVANLDVLNDQSFAFLVYHKADDFDRLRKQLYRSSRKITILEVADRMAGNVGVSTRWSLLKNLRLLGVELRSGVRITNIEEDVVIIETETGTEFISADTIIIAVGSQSVNDLARDLKIVGTEVIMIGDSREPRRITDAVREGFDAAMSF